ncbi:MAG: aldo/keto reductase [Defluviitaleaceae bacterium]|nr:aldo/keto reductase [Defluviitaleaceae bacterium]
MNYRELGKTGKKVSEIGFGLEHLDRKPYAQVEETLNEALRHGVNLLDIFMPGTEVRENIQKALSTRRKDVYIQGHIGSTDVGKQYDISRDMPTVKKYFEEMLRLYGYIDFGMLFFIDSEEDYKNVFETEFITYAERLKKNGDIHHIGFSSHNPVTATKVIETGTVEMMMFSINPAFDMIPVEESVFDHLDNNFKADVLRGLDPKRAELYKLCTQKNIGITVMKALGSGKLLSPEHTPYKKPLTTYQCVHYALSRPAVASVLPGCQTIEEMAQIMGYFSASNAEKDYAEAISTVRNDFAGNCVYCSHCQPCPVGIDIATVTKYLDIGHLDEGNIPPSIRQHYAALNSADCIECGHCEKRCPFGVPVIKNMKDAARILGGK